MLKPDIVSIYCRAVDFFNILAYDYHASTEALTDHHAPLFALPGASEYDHRTQLNVVSTTTAPSSMW